MANEEVNSGRRRFLTGTTAVIGAVVLTRIWGLPEF